MSPTSCGRLAGRARLDGDFSGHALMSGFVTAAAQVRVPLDVIMRTTRRQAERRFMTWMAQLTPATCEAFRPRLVGNPMLGARRCVTQ